MRRWVLGCLLVIALSMAALRAKTDEYRIYLVQPEGASVDSWDFQVHENRWVMIEGLDAILDPSESCLAATVWLDEPGYVRARAWRADELIPSEWSHPIPAPEPGVGLGLGLGVIGLASIATMRARAVRRESRRG